MLDEVGAAADRAELLAEQGRELHFEADEKTGRVIVQVRDLASGKVIRTIPPEGAGDRSRAARTRHGHLDRPLRMASGRRHRARSSTS